MKESKYKSVLLVDDSYIDNLISRKIIEKSNFAEEIIVLNSPYDAINYLRDCLSSGADLPEIIFLDIRMPEMSGFDFLKEINAINGFEIKKVKIYMLSSSLDPYDLRRIKEHGLISNFIGKPLTNKALQEI